MKNLRLLFGVCLGALVFGASWAIDADDIARAATRRDTLNSNTTTLTRNVPSSTQKTLSTTPRGTSTPARTVATESRTTTTNKSVTTRPTVATTTRATTSIVPRTISHNASTSNSSRTTTKSRVATRGALTRAATSRQSTKTRTIPNVARAATRDETGKLVTNYTKCREIYYECMDEFCANKDTNLRRCACSSRATEFNRTQKQLTKFEDQMLDFNQRLLLVNMDAEDVATINESTEGEDAFYATPDRTKSKRTLDAISKKLNDTFDSDSSGGFSLAPISLSLNEDAAFDSIDSLGGIDTTTKSGTALYSAATPICRDVAAEVCTEDELSLAASGYQMMIEQDCNTVFKAYQSQVDQARSKVFESNALLDMSRLDAYQTRNSDDMLACKRKMLEMLKDTTVCGANLEKCLDMTGKYIDPTTGTAFLTNNLGDLANLITRPAANQTWTSANANGKFINYLENRKHYLEPAMENCQSIADSVWDAFIEDALAQIKLAQIAKLEEIRQACTTLTSECMNSAIDSINEFDARSLSVFGVAANRTANAMCADIKNSCTALIDSTGDTLWASGVSDIMTNQTYETIVSSCTQVGRNCIVQSCKSISGNFDLCNDIDLSPNRHAILERTACWPDVLACVGAAGDTALLSIRDILGLRSIGDYKYALYKQMYGYANPTRIDNFCKTTCDTGTDADCVKCRIAESIWGNCEDKPTNIIQDTTTNHNQILTPNDSTDPKITLLSWFADNTDTAGNARSCVNTRCDANSTAHNSTGDTVCIGPDDAQYITDDGLYCPAPEAQVIPITSGLTNCCPADNVLSDNICCGENMNDGFCLPNNTQLNIKKKFRYSNTDKYLVCVGTRYTEGTASATGFPGGNELRCDGGRWILVTDNKTTYSTKSAGTNSPRPVKGYYDASDWEHSNMLNWSSGTTGWFVGWQ